MISKHNHNIYLNLERTAQRLPDKVAIAESRGRDGAQQLCFAEVTFAELVRRIEQCSGAWVARGITRGTRVLLVVPPSIDFAVIAHSLFRVGAVPIILDPGESVERLVTLIGEASPEVIIGAPFAIRLEAAGPRAFATVKLSVVVGGDAPGAQHFETLALGSHPEVPTAELGPDDLMAIVFTSGSTGLPKGVALTPRMMSAMRDPLRCERYGWSERSVDLVTYPINLLTTPPLGLTLVLPELAGAPISKIDPARIVETIIARGCTTSLGSPVFWGRIVEHCIERDLTLPAMQSLLVAGAPVSPSLVRRLRDVLPNAICHTAIGSTECGALASADTRDLLRDALAHSERGGGVCVGLPFADHEVRVIAIRDRAIEHIDQTEPLAEGAIGEIIVKGPAASPSYFRRADETRRTKIHDSDDTFWHRTGDVGYFDERGRLWFCGRVAHILQHAGRPYYPIMVESMFNADPSVQRSGLVQVQSDAGSQLVLCLELRSGKRGREVAASILGHARSLGLPISRALVHAEGLPVDARHNATIDYPALSAWATRQLQSN